MVFAFESGKKACGYPLCLPWKEPRLKRSNRPETTKKSRIIVLQWYQLIFELIDMRSFSNLWYWIVLTVVWSSASQWVLGVPFDMISRAKRDGGQAQEDLETIVRIKVSRLLNIVKTSGMWMVGFTAFLFAVLVLLAFEYKIEFAQAVLFLFAPMNLLFFLSIRTASLIQQGENQGVALNRRLMMHRMTTQLIGMISILVTAMFGMYQNVTIGALG
ncbi:MAG: hypothetical protein RIR95_408 [Pseudomonadota bacterium]|jgi:hypothetical protein